MNQKPEILEWVAAAPGWRAVFVTEDDVREEPVVAWARVSADDFPRFLPITIDRCRTAARLVSDQGCSSYERLAAIVGPEDPAEDFRTRAVQRELRSERQLQEKCDSPGS